MSDFDQGPGEDEGFDASATGDGFLSTFDVADFFGELTSATSPEELQSVLDEHLAIEKPFMSAADYATWDALDDAFFEAYSSGYLNPPDFPKFFSWLFYNQGITTIGLVAITSGALIGLIYAYAASHGNNTLGLEAAINPGQFTFPTFMPPPPAIAAPSPPLSDNQGNRSPFAPAAPVAFPNAPAPPSPDTPGGHIVKKALSTTQPVGITAAGVDQEIATAISAAMQAETSKITGIIAQSIDQALGGLQPGHAKAQIAANAKNISALKTAVINLQISVKADDVAAVKADLATVTTEVDKLISQMDLTVPSALDTRVNTIGTELQTDFSELTTKVEKLISQMDLTVPSALDTQLNSVDAKATDALAMLALATPSALDTALNGVEASMTKVKADIDDLDECCSENSAVTNPIRAGGATSSLLGQLGNVLKWAFGIGAVMSIVDTVATILDFPATFAATAADTEAIATWADSAANQLITNKSYPAWMVP